MRGLIVNADDWGMDARATDAALDAFRRGLVTQVTAMVYMADSDRAAGLARDAGMPVGLHLNLSEPFDGEDVPPVVRRRQAELATRFSATGRRWRRWLPDWRAQREIDRAIEDQLERFEMLYGRRPSHVDGHHHVHVSPSVARAPALAGFPLRRAIDDETPIPAPIAAARRARRRLILQGRTPTDRFVPISRLRTNLLGGQRPAAFGNANEIVEVMVHPAVPEERSLLVSSAWQELVRRERLTCYGELPWP